MEKDLPVFRTLLTVDEYNALMEKYATDGNTQTNYYFDTAEFSLNAFDIIVRVKEKQNNTYNIAIRRKKSYSIEELKEDLTKETFDKLMNEGVLLAERASAAIYDVLRGRKLFNYLSLSTYRCPFIYGNCKAFIDKCTYLDQTDYELELHSVNYDEGKRQFINLIKEMNITYKKCKTKVKRSYAALIKYI